MTVMETLAANRIADASDASYTAKQVSLNQSSNPNQVQIGGSHYIKQSIQPWDYMQAVMTGEAFAAYLQGNVIKYMSRYKAKNGVQDLQKAQHYLAKLISIHSST